MRRSVRLIAAASCLSMVAGLISIPAAAEPGGPQTREAGRVRVIGRVSPKPGRDAATSLDAFATARARTRAPSDGGAAAPSAPRAAAPTSTFGFDAQTDLDSASPSDTTGALGEQFFVTAVNSRVAVYDRTGAEVLAPKPLDELHQASQGRFSFDPKVVYDPYKDVFVLVYIVQEDSPRISRIIVAAIPGGTADALNTWCVTSFRGDLVTGAPKLWADYPGLGFDGKRVTVATNMFAFPSATGNFRYAQVMSLDKDPLYDCGAEAPVATVFVGGSTRDPKGRKAFTLQPAQTIGGPATSQYLVSFQRGRRGKGSYLTIWRIKRTSRGLRMRRGVVGVGRVTPPPPGTQGDGSLTDPDTWWDAGDERLTSAFYDADRGELFAAHAVRKNITPDPVTGGYPEAVIRWYEVDPAKRLDRSRLDRKGLIGKAEADVGWPSMATDDQGRLFVTYSRASAPRGEYLSAWVAEVARGSFAASQRILEPGLARYDTSNGIERWGDYTAINRDPLDGSVLATFNQYAADVARWQQVVNLVTHA